jgi:hypothetical protein
VMAKLLTQTGCVAPRVALRSTGFGPDRAGGLVSRRGHTGLLTKHVTARGKA